MVKIWCLGIKKRRAIVKMYGEELEWKGNQIRKYGDDGNGEKEQEERKGKEKRREDNRRQEGKEKGKRGRESIVRE